MRSRRPCLNESSPKQQNLWNNPRHNPTKKIEWSWKVPSMWRSCSNANADTFSADIHKALEEWSTGQGFLHAPSITAVAPALMRAGAVSLGQARRTGRKGVGCAGGWRGSGRPRDRPIGRSA